MEHVKTAIELATRHAPYLAESLNLFPYIRQDIQDRNPDFVFDQLCQSLPPISENLDTEMSVLRQFKRKAHLIIAIADLAGDWDWVAVTERLTQLADICMNRILTVAATELGIEGQPDNPVPGLFALAVGKYGARELNYSSDIDFNVFYDPNLVQLPNPARAERTLIKLAQSLVKGFERMTGDGYIFRTDLRLRPDPRSNAIVVSTHTAERYYETLGQNWERAAMIKARVCAGDLEAGQAFIDDVLSPFIWRRNLDYAAIDDILAIKRQIHAGAGGFDIHVPGHHLKLGKGGIREIEFYAQVQQLILGGRHPELRKKRTVEALSVLSEQGYISPDDAHALSKHYALLRTLEHRAQMIADEQTHLVPQDETERENFSRLCGYATRTICENIIHDTLVDVHERYVALFPEAETLSGRMGNLVFTGVDPDPATLATLKDLGFVKPEIVWTKMAAWLGGRIAATRTERARETLTSLAPRLIETISEMDEPDMAFEAFSDFFGSLNQGVSILSMFSNEPERLKQIVKLLTYAPQMSERLAKKPAILDAMVDPNFLNIAPETIASDYVETIAKAQDFELALNLSRRRVREDHFRVIAATLLGHISISEAPLFFSAIADATIKALLPFAVSEVERVSGKMEGEVAVLGLGKLGGREMRLTSDLDIMLIYEAGDNEDNPQRFYSKITQRLISALSSVTEEGGLFEVDMALRPSGRAGPVAVSVDAFTSYYNEKAWTWEFMALTRARIIAAGSDGFFKALKSRLEQAMLADRDDLNMAVDIADMLSRTKAEKLPRSEWDIKNISGGLRDAEYIVQSMYLQKRSDYYQAGLTGSVAMCRMAMRLGQVSQEEARQVEASISFYGALSQFMSLTGRDTANGAFAREILKQADVIDSDDNVLTQLQDYQACIESLVDKYI